MSDPKDDREQESGVHISSSGPVTIHGDVVGRDKITTGLGGEQVADLLKQFAEIHRQIDARPPDPRVDKEEIHATVQRIEQEVKKGEQANPDKVARWLNFLSGMSGDIFDVVTATLTNPAAGIARTVQLIAKRAKEQAHHGE